MADIPLISCLCVTRRRTGLLERAIGSFRDQTYPRKELVVVYEGDDEDTAGFMRGIGDENIRAVEAPATPGLTLGELRNISVDKSGGEYFCQWDDDDWSHRERLSFQMEVIRKSGMQASVLMQWLIFDNTRKKAYISARRPWEGSLLCKKSLITGDLKYNAARRGEDTPLVNSLFKNGLVFPVIMPKLYIYVYHGGNVWTVEHWKSIFSASRALSDSASLIIGDILAGEYTGEDASDLLDKIEE